MVNFHPWDFCAASKMFPTFYLITCYDSCKTQKVPIDDVVFVCIIPSLVVCDRISYFYSIAMSTYSSLTY